MDCPACARIAKVRAGADPFFIAELRESYALLHKHQSYKGWVAVFMKEHVEHLHELPVERQLRLWQDVADVAKAITAAFGPVRLNYECLGNVVAHAHWHVIPRYRAPVDPEPGATVWVRPAAELDCGVSDAERGRLIEALRGAGLRSIHD